MDKNRLCRGLIIAAIAAMGTTFGVHPCFARPRPKPHPRPRHRPAARVTPQLIIHDIRQGVKYLLAHEQSPVPWGKSRPGWTSGETSLVTEALLEVNSTLRMRRLNIFQPAMKRAIQYIIHHPIPQTYYVSFSANALALLPHKSEYRLALRDDARYLLRAINRVGGYTYNLTPKPAKNVRRTRWRGRGRGRPKAPAYVQDNSNSQYGVLGTWACAHYGIGIPYRYWKLAAYHWIHTQDSDGSWGYQADQQRPQTFTPAGVASLLICDEFLGANESSDRPRPDPSVVRGLAWINRHFPATTPDQYTMYCYVRVGLASGLTEFGGQNWYDDFARTLTIGRDKPQNGAWKAFFSPLSISGSTGQIIGTAYSLLILDRGLNPIFMSKLQYSKNYYGRWNLRPRDVANMTSYVAQHTEAPLSWQVVNINSPVSQWLNSPILYISGNRDPKFTKAQIDRLREYVDDGGLIYCAPVDGSFSFRQAMIKYAGEVFRHKYEFKSLTPKSQLMQMQPYYHVFLPTMAISNGVRYLWVISPENIGTVWQRREFSEQTYWQFPINLFLYSTGKSSLGTRLTSLVVPPPQSGAVRSVNVGLLKFTGNWNPEPGAWKRMAKLAAAKFQTTVKVSSVTPQSLNGSGIKVLDLTGTGKVSFSSTDIAAIRKFLNGGGMLYANAAGGNLSFSDSVQHLIRKLYPNTPLVSLPSQCSIYQGKFPGGINAEHATYRIYYTRKMGFKSTPQLLGVKKNGRWVVIFSQDDITSGLLGTNTWGILGYAPKSAINLTRNVLCYAAAH